MSFPAFRRDVPLAGGYFGEPKEKETREVLSGRVLKENRDYVDHVAERFGKTVQTVMDDIVRLAQVINTELEPLNEELEAFGKENDLVSIEKKFPEIVALAVKQFLASRPGSKTKPKK